MQAAVVKVMAAKVAVEMDWEAEVREKAAAVEMDGAKAAKVAALEAMGGP